MVFIAKLHLWCVLNTIHQPFPFSSLLPFPSQTLSWLKDNVSMATQVCSIASFEGLEAARRCQHTLEQEILNNRARIEVVKRVNSGTSSHSQFLSKYKCRMNEKNVIENRIHIWNLSKFFFFLYQTNNNLRSCVRKLHRTYLKHPIKSVSCNTNSSCKLSHHPSA